MDPNIKQKNLDSAILFMQQDHANTLKGLHSEIAHLQKRCSELTFQLAMENTHISQEDEFKEKVVHLEESLKAQSRTRLELTSVVESKEKEIESLKKRNVAQEQKHRLEMEELSQRLLLAQQEHNNKCDEIANLRLKLRSYKVKMASSEAPVVHSQERHSISSAGSVRSSRSSGSASPAIEDSPRTPLPPPDTPPKFRRRGPRSLVNESSASKNGRKLSTGENVPDPTPFLKQSVVGSGVLKQSYVRESDTKVPLPPILPRGSTRSSNKPAEFEAGKRVPQKNDSYKIVSRRQRKDGTQSELVMETLAVDEITKRNHEMHQAHGYGSSEG